MHKFATPMYLWKQYRDVIIGRIRCIKEVQAGQKEMEQNRNKCSLVSPGELKHYINIMFPAGSATMCILEFSAVCACFLLLF